MLRDDDRSENLYTAPIALPGSAQSADDDDAPDIDAPEISYDEQRYPARPRRLRPRDQFRRGSVRRNTTDPRTANGTNPSYIEWLVRRSMLKDADVLARQLSGQPSMWRNPYARPDARRAIATSDVWFTAYPISLITRPGQSFLAALGDDALWSAFERIGITAIHTGPVKSAGGSVIDDIVPGHTGKGADFRLAEMGYKDYPGIYHMVEIPPEDWALLPEVPEGEDSVNLDPAAEHELSERGYIIGALQRVIFYTPGVKETNWSATAPVTGPDGVSRRWVYLHYFKQGQPSINWLDPTFAGMRLVIGDALHSLGELGAGALRLDANGFLGVEKSAEGLPAWSEGHPLSHAANHIIAGMVRKVGGFTFQELNLTIEDIRDTGAVGADLSYDFIGRPGYHHALATGQTEFLRLALTSSLELGVQPVQLVHGLQNHDELTYELVHWATRHGDDVYRFRGREITGGELAEEVRADLTERLTGAADFNRVFTQNGIACTTASLIAATRGVSRLDEVTDADVPTIREAHLLLCAYNAWQPGVFALSGWDLVGMLTVPAEEIADLLRAGDTRWIERGAHDLLGVDPEATRSAAGMPRGRALYGPLPEQLRDPGSFASRLSRILELRRRHGIATATQVDIPEVALPACSSSFTASTTATRAAKRRCRSPC